MKFAYSHRALSDLNKAPSQVRRAFFKQVLLLADNLRHPSLRAKKYDEFRDVWQARVTGNWRFYFRIEDDCYYILNVEKHPK